MNPKEARKTYNEIIECDCLNCEVEILAKKLFCYIEELERQNELLRAVAEAARAHIGSEWNPERTMLPESTEATCIWWLEKAINGGALEDKQ